MAPLSNTATAQWLMVRLINVSAGVALLLTAFAAFFPAHLQEIATKKSRLPQYATTAALGFIVGMLVAVSGAGALGIAMFLALVAVLHCLYFALRATDIPCTFTTERAL